MERGGREGESLRTRQIAPTRECKHQSERPEQRVRGGRETERKHARARALQIERENTWGEGQAK